MKQLFLALSLLLGLVAQAAQAVDLPYKVGFLGVSREANPAGRVQSFSEQNGPYFFVDGTSLYVRDEDGAERTLVEGKQGEFLAVHDIAERAWGGQVYYSHIFSHDGKTYCDLFRVPVSGGEPERLTNAVNEWSGAEGVYPKGLKLGVWNTAPSPTPEGVVFCSDRDGLKSPGEVFRAHQLYRIRPDGVQERIDWMNFGGVLHPHYHHGWIYVATNQQQGLRGRNGSGWVTWRMRPDGSEFEPWLPLLAVPPSIGFHNTSHTSDGHFLFDGYYDTRAFGFVGAFPRHESSPVSGQPTQFGPVGSVANPFFWVGWDSAAERPRQGNIFRIGHQPRGLFNPLPMFHFQDVTNVDSDGSFQREIGHPRGAPDNRWLATWTGDNPDHRQLDIVLVRPITEKPNPPVVGMPADSLPSSKPLDYFERVTDTPDRHEWYGTPLVEYAVLYGNDPPPAPVRERDEATAYGRVVSAYVGDPEVADDRPYHSQQVTIPESEIADMAILHFTPTLAGLNVAPPVNNDTVNQGVQTQNREGFSSAFNERAGIYEQIIHLRKWITPTGAMYVGNDPPAGSTPLVTDGKPDLSFAMDIPAKHAWTFQLRRKDGRAIPFGTADTWHSLIPAEHRNCMGCHDHEFPVTTPFELTGAARLDYVVPKLNKVRIVEYHRDVKPIEDRTGIVIGSTPYKVSGGPKPYLSANWPLLDNPAFTDAERRTLAEWCDTGFMAATEFTGGEPITADSGQGPWADGTPPALDVVATPGVLSFAAVDPETGVDWSSLSITSTEPVAGREAGAELADLATHDGEHGHLSADLKGLITVTLRDHQRARNAAGEVISEAGNLATVTVAAPDLPEPRNPSGLFVGMEDVLGEVRERDPDGRPDYHVRLTGLDPTRPIAFVDVKVGDATTQFPANYSKNSSDAGEESTENPDGKWWIAEQEPSIAAGNVATATLDIWYTLPEGLPHFAEHRVYVVYDRENIADRDFIRVAIPEPDPDPDDCAAQIAALEARIAVLEQDAEANAAEIAELQGKIDAAKAALE